MEVKVSPSSAAILVDGIGYGRKGRAKINLPEGHWTVELRAPGYLPQRVELNVLQGVHYSIDRRLEPDRHYAAADRRLAESGKSLRVS